MEISGKKLQEELLTSLKEKIGAKIKTCKKTWD